MARLTETQLIQKYRELTDTVDAIYEVAQEHGYPHRKLFTKARKLLRELQQGTKD